MKNKTIAFISALCLGITGVGSVPVYSEDIALTFEDQSKDTLKSVTVDRNELRIGETAQISVEWNEDKDEKPYVAYSSGRRSVATVDNSGVITAQGSGTAVITVSANGVEFTFSIDVKPVETGGTFGDGMSWSFDEETSTLTISGEGELELDSDVPWLDWHPYIKKAVISEGITNIHEDTFPICTKLETVELPSTVVSIDTLAFFVSVSLSEIDVSPENSYFTSCDGVLFSKDMTELIKYPINKADEEYAVPDGVNKLGLLAFAMCRNLRAVVIPDSVVYIDENFTDCKLLEDVTMSGGLEYISGRSLQNTPWIAAQREKDPIITFNDILFDGKAYSGEYTADDGIAGFSPFAFAHNSELTAVTLPRNMEELSACAFYSCASLENVTFSDNLRSIGVYAFEDTALTSVVIPGTVENIGQGAFDNCPELVSVTILDPDCDIYDQSDTICNSSAINSSTVYSGVIRGYKGSTAEVYAEKYGYTFEEIVNIKGDVNLDGEVTAADLVLLSSYVMNGRSAVYSWENGDLSDDGRLSSFDVCLLRKMLTE